MAPPTLSGMEFGSVVGDRQRWRVARMGDGPPVVLMHGFPDGPESWAATADALVGAGYEVIVPYLRGYHVDTVVPGRRYHDDSIGQDVIGLLDALGVERAALVGHDWGASSAYSAVRQAPDRVVGLVAIGIPHPGAIELGPGLLWQGRHLLYFKLPLAEQRMRRSHLSYITKLYARWAPGWTGPERDATLDRAIDLLSDPSVAHHAVRWYRDLDLSAKAPTRFTIACPTLFVAGGVDFGGDVSAYERSVRRVARRAELMVVDGAGHWPHREDEPRFISRLTRFLASLG